MILYIVSHHFSQVICEASEECNLNILRAIVDSKFSFSQFLKQQLSQLQSANILLLDLSCLTDTDEEIIMTLTSFRLLYEESKVIVVAPNREVGDKLLSEIFSMGIYDIIIPSLELEGLKKDIIDSIQNGKTYKSSIKYKVNSDLSNDEKEKNSFGKEVIVKEKIIIKNEIKSSVNKALIGFVGSQERIGVTHNAIVSGYFLKEQGYRIAIVENSFKRNKCFQEISESFDLDHESDDYFSINNVDFYMDFDFKELHRVLSKNYNFIILDFGLFEEIDLLEFSRCVKQVVVCGSKPWETSKLNNIFSSAEQTILEDYIYLFNYTDLTNAPALIEGMGELNKVFFTEYSPDPFNSSYFTDLKAIFKEYISEKTVTEIKNKKFPFDGLKKRILKR